MNWTIIGCGWLGTSLGETLVQNGDSVIGTTTTLNKQKLFAEKGIKNEIFQLNSQISTEIIDFSEIIVLSIPPVDRNNVLKYGELLVDLVKQFKSTSKFIFLSSTGVYPQKEGLFNEDYSFTSSEKETSLYQAEKQLSEYLENRLTILRLGGLFGNDRHPIYSLSGKIGIKNPLGKINFVGKKDVISVIQLIAKQQIFGEVFNVVFPNHPTRESYYTEKAKELNLIAPTFDYSQSIFREISSAKIQNKFGFIFAESI